MHTQFGCSRTEQSKINAITEARELYMESQVWTNGQLYEERASTVVASKWMKGACPVDGKHARPWD